MSEGRVEAPRGVLREAGRAISVAAVLLACLGGGFVLFLYNLPQLRDEDKAVLKQFPPTSVSDLKQQREVLLAYGRTYPGSVLAGFGMLYILMQTFAVPGTLSLSLLAGALFGVYKGLLLVSIISTAGSTSCYLLSQTIGKRLARAIWPDKVDGFGREVDRRRNDMFSYIVFLRVTPILPNTFINMASPVVGVPLFPFITGTIVGCAPNNFVAVNAGNKLSELQSLSELYDVKHLIMGLGIGVVALLPVVVRRRAERKDS